MKPCLVDVNVFLALLVRHHEHHKRAKKWFADLSAGEAGLCRVVQLSLVRLLGNRSVMGTYAVNPREAWGVLQELLGDERVEFVAEPDGVDYAFPLLLKHPTPSPKVVADAYLAAVAISARRKLITFDAGFRQYSRLDFQVLDH